MHAWGRLRRGALKDENGGSQVRTGSPQNWAGSSRYKLGFGRASVPQAHTCFDEGDFCVTKQVARICSGCQHQVASYHKVLVARNRPNSDFVTSTRAASLPLGRGSHRRLREPVAVGHASGHVRDSMATFTRSVAGWTRHRGNFRRGLGSHPEIHFGQQDPVLLAGVECQTTCVLRRRRGRPEF